VALEIAVVVALMVLNGLFAMSETAMVSARRARLKERPGGDRGPGRRWITWTCFLPRNWSCLSQDSWSGRGASPSSRCWPPWSGDLLVRVAPVESTQITWALNELVQSSLVQPETVTGQQQE
jgi:hypothetical protein